MQAYRHHCICPLFSSFTLLGPSRFKGKNLFLKAHSNSKTHEVFPRIPFLVSPVPRTQPSLTLNSTPFFDSLLAQPILTANLLGEGYVHEWGTEKEDHQSRELVRFHKWATWTSICTCRSWFNSIGYISK